MKDENDFIEVCDAIYKLKNPTTEMDTPSSVYESLEDYKFDWIQSQSYTTETLFEYLKRKLGI